MSLVCSGERGGREQVAGEVDGDERQGEDLEGCRSAGKAPGPDTDSWCEMRALATLGAGARNSALLRMAREDLARLHGRLKGADSHVVEVVTCGWEVGGEGWCRCRSGCVPPTRV